MKLCHLKNLDGKNVMTELYDENLNRIFDIM